MKNLDVALIILTTLAALGGWAKYFSLRSHYRKLYQHFEKLNQTYIKFVNDVDSAIPKNENKYFIVGAVVVFVSALLALVFAPKDE